MSDDKRWLKVRSPKDWVFSVSLIAIMLIGLVLMWWATRG